MNWQHLQAFVWLRWRLLVNQWRRAGAVNAVLMMIVIVGALVTAIPLFIGCFMLGLYVIPKAAPAHLMYAWDGVIVAFLFFWGIGLVTELQRTEPLSLSKFLHLPVSVNGAFLINYLSSLLRLSLIVFVPVMLGFSLALGVDQGDLAAAGPAGTGGFPADGHGADLSVSGLAGLADEQSPPPPDGHRGHDDDLRSVVQLPNLLNFFAPWGASTAGRPVESTGGRAGEARPRDQNRRKSMPRSSCAGSRKSSKGTQLALREADRVSTGTMEPDGSAREHGLACRMAAAGRHGRGRGPRHAVDSGAAGNDADRNGQSLAGVPHDDRTVSGAVLQRERPVGARAPRSHRR